MSYNNTTDFIHKFGIDINDVVYVRIKCSSFYTHAEGCDDTEMSDDV